ncbi:MAG: tyrosine-type recombinase/integrase [Anaerolineae bacterium]|nr:tyrosine-type recombinase/integrase [Anaerolineae bacterium]
MSFLQKRALTVHDILRPRSADDKDAAHRLRLFADWLESQQLAWYQPEFNTYRDYLLNDYSGRFGQPLSPASVKAHLATVRGHYQLLLSDNRIRDALYAITPEAATTLERKAFVDEIISRLHNALDPAAAAVKTITRQDVLDDEHVRLTPDQAAALMAAPGLATLTGIRDTAIITLLLCTGLREMELCALDVPDLRRKLGGQTAVHVRRGKGSKERLIPYGSLIWSLNTVERWLHHAGIDRGPVFRGFYKDGKHLRAERISTRAIHKILQRYPIHIDGALRLVQPHDLRRTYARRLYEAGMDLLAIRDNLGHADSRTTLRYIGAMDVDKRLPPALYTRPPLPPEEA